MQSLVLLLVLFWASFHLANPKKIRHQNRDLDQEYPKPRVKFKELNDLPLDKIIPDLSLTRSLAISSFGSGFQNERRKLSVIQENLNDGISLQALVTETGSLKYSTNEMPALMAVSHSKYIVQNVPFSLQLIISKSLLIEDTVLAEFSSSKSSFKISSVCSLDQHSYYNQHYNCEFEEISTLEELTLSYTVIEKTSMRKVSAEVLTSWKIHAIEMPVLTEASPRYLEVDTTNEDSYTQTIRIFGENLRTDFSQVLFGEKAQRSFTAADDGSFIDIDAPIISFYETTDQLIAEVKLQINDGEDLFTNSITVVYFRLEIQEIRVKCNCKIPQSSSFPLECINGNDIVFSNTANLIRYQKPILVESLTGSISPTTLVERLNIQTNMDLEFETGILNNVESGTVTLQKHFQGKSYYSGQLEILQSPILLRFDNDLLHERSTSCLTIRIILNNTPQRQNSLCYVIVDDDFSIMRSGSTETIETNVEKICLLDPLPLGSYKMHLTRDNCTLSEPLSFNIIEIPTVSKVTPCALDSVTGGNLFIKGFNFTKITQVKLGEYVVPSENTEINGLLTMITLSFGSIPDWSLFNINSEIYLSNNQGIDWMESGVFIQFISMNTSSTLYSNLHSSFTDLLDPFTVLSSDSESRTSECSDNLKAIPTVISHEEYYKLFIRVDKLLKAEETRIEISSFSFDCIIESYCMVNISQERYFFHYINDTIGYCQIGDLVKAYSDYQSPLEISLYARFYTFEEDQVLPIQQDSEQHQALAYVFKGLSFLKLDYEDSFAPLLETRRKVDIKISPIFIPEYYRTRIKCFLNDIDDFENTSKQQYTGTSELGTSADGKYEDISCEFNIRSGDIRRYYVTLQIDDISIEYQDQEIFTAGLPKITEISSETFEYDYYQIGRTTEDVTFRIIYEGFIDFTCKFEIYTETEVKIISTIQATYVSKVDGNLLTPDLINGISILEYKCQIGWEQILQNSENQIYLSISSLASTPAKYLYDTYTGRFTELIKAIKYLPSSSIKGYQVYFEEKSAGVQIEVIFDSAGNPTITQDWICKIQNGLESIESSVSIENNLKCEFLVARATKTYDLTLYNSQKKIALFKSLSNNDRLSFLKLTLEMNLLLKYNTYTPVESILMYSSSSSPEVEFTPMQSATVACLYRDLNYRSSYISSCEVPPIGMTLFKDEKSAAINIQLEITTSNVTYLTTPSSLTLYQIPLFQDWAVTGSTINWIFQFEYTQEEARKLFKCKFSVEAPATTMSSQDSESFSTSTMALPSGTFVLPTTQSEHLQLEVEGSSTGEIVTEVNKSDTGIICDVTGLGEGYFRSFRSYSLSSPSLVYTIGEEAIANIEWPEEITEQEEAAVDEDIRAKELEVKGAFQEWDCSYYGIEGTEETFGTLFSSERLERMECRSFKKYWDSTVVVGIDVDYDYFHEVLIQRSVNSVYNRPLLSFVPSTLIYPSESTQTFEITSSDSFGILSSLNTTYSVNLNRVSSNCSYSAPSITCNIEPNSTIFSLSPTPSISVAITPHDPLFTLYTSSISLESPETTTISQSSEEFSAEAVLTNTTGLFYNAFETPAYEVRAETAQGLSGPEALLVLRTSQQYDHCLEQSCNCRFVLDQEYITQARVEKQLVSARGDVYDYYAYCTLPEEIKFWKTRIGQIEEIELRDSKQRILLKYINQKKVYAPVLQLSEEQVVLSKGLREEFGGIRIINGDLDQTNSKCIFRNRDGNNGTMQTIPVFSTGFMSCPFDFTLLSHEIQYFDVFLRYETGVLNEVWDIRITRNSLNNEITYTNIESTFENEGVVIINSAFQIYFDNTERVKYSEDTIISINLHSSLTNVTQNLILSKIIFERNFVTNIASAISTTEGKSDTSNLEVLSDRDTAKGLSITAALNPSRSIFKNSTGIQLCFMLSTNGILVCSLNQFYILQPLECSISPVKAAISKDPSLITLNCSLRQIFEINEQSPDIRLAISASVPDEVLIDEVVSPILQEKQQISFNISSKIVDSSQDEITMNLKVLALECPNCKSSLLDCNKIQQCSQNDQSSRQKIFWSCDNTGSNCYHDSTDLNTLEFHSSQGSLQYTKIREDIILQTQARLETLQLFNIKTIETLYTNSQTNLTDNLEITSVQEIQDNIRGSLKCLQTLSSGKTFSSTPVFTSSMSLYCSVMVLSRNEKSQVTLLYLLEGSEEVVSNNITLQTFAFEISKYYPLLSFKNGGGKFTIEIEPGILNFDCSSSSKAEGVERLKTLGCQFGLSTILPATFVSNTKLTCQIPPWSQNKNIVVNLISFDSTQRILGDSLSLRYCDYQTCAEEYKCRYSLYQDGVQIYQTIVEEGLSTTSTRANTTSYCTGESLKYSGSYKIEVSVDDGDTWIETSSDLVTIQSNYSEFSIIQSSKSYVYLPGRNTIKLISNYKADSGDIFVEVQTSVNQIYNIAPTSATSLDISFIIDSTEIEEYPSFLRYRLGITSKGLYTSWTGLEIRMNAVLLNVLPRISWGIDSLQNISSIHNIQKYLPMMFEIQATQYLSGIDDVYCTFDSPQIRDGKGIFWIIKAVEESNKLLCKITEVSDLITKFLDEEISLTVTKHLDVYNPESGMLITIRPIPQITTISIDSIEMMNTSLSDIDHLNLTVTGINFRIDTLRNSYLDFIDSEGRLIQFDTDFAIFDHTDTLKMVIPQPLTIENLLLPNRLILHSGISGAEFTTIENPPDEEANIIVDHSVITLDSTGAASISPSIINITLQDPILYTEDIKAYLLHYLSGEYSLTIISYNRLESDNSLLASITVNLPIISTPKKLEVYIEPILEHRIVFEKSEFEYKMNTLIEVEFPVNNTVIQPVMIPSPKIYNVTPDDTDYETTRFMVSGEDLDSSIECTYSSPVKTVPIVFINSSYGYCDLTWTANVFQEIVLFTNGTNLHQVTYSKTISLEEPSRDLSWCMIDNYRSIFGVISESEKQCSIEYGYNLFSYPVDSLFFNDTYTSVEFSKVVPNVLRDAQSDPVTELHVLGKGITQEYDGKLACHFTAGDSYSQVVDANIVSENIIKCSIPYDVYQFGASSKSYNFILLANDISLGHVLLSVKHKDKSLIVPNSEFILITNSVIRITTRAKIMYFDKNNQIVQLELQDSSDVLDLSNILSKYSQGLSAPTKSYSCIFTDAVGEVLFSSTINTDYDRIVLSREGYPDVKYFTLYCNYPNTASSVIPTKMYISEKYSFQTLEYNFISNSIDIIVEAQPLVTSVTSTGFDTNDAGVVTLAGTFDTSRTLYLRITHQDWLKHQVVPVNVLTSTQADYNLVLDKSLYILEVSYYSDQFCDSLPWERYKKTIDDINLECIAYELNVTSTPVVQSDFTLNLNADIVDRCCIYPETTLLTKVTDIDNSGNILDCDIPSNVINSTLSDQLVEVCLFTDGTPALEVLRSDILEITSIEPSVLFKNLYTTLESSYETIKVFVSHLPQFTAKMDCKYNNIVLTSLGTGDDGSGNKYVLCPIPLFPNFEGSLAEGNKSVLVELQNCGEKIYTSASSSVHTVKILDTPEIDTSSKMYFPRFIEYPLDSVIRDEDKLVITGTNFDSSFTYYCAFLYGLSAVDEIQAEFLTSTTIRCRPIDFDHEAFVGLQVKVVSEGISIFAYGTIDLFLYEMPKVQKIFPTYASYDQQVEVSVTISSLPYIHNVHCKFGTTDAALVTIYRQGKQIICKAPVISSSNPTESIKMHISVDNHFWYESEQDLIFFATPTFTGVDSLIMPLFARSHIVVQGTNFIDTGSLLICRLKITSNEYYDLKVEYISSTELRCLNPPHYLSPITGVELSVTFNMLNFYQVVNNMEYKNVPKVFTIDKIYGKESPVSNTITVTGEGFTDSTLASVGGFKDDIVFTPSSDTSGTFDLPAYVNISEITGSPYTYMCYFDLEADMSRYCANSYQTGKMAFCFVASNSMLPHHYLVSKEDYGWVCIDKFPRSRIEVGIPGLDFSFNGVSYQYLELPDIDTTDPRAVFKDTANTILVKGEGFWDTDALSCRLRTTDSTTTLSLLTTNYINSTTIGCEFPAVSSTSATYKIGVTLNGYEFTDEVDEAQIYVNDPLTIVSVFPIVMFKNAIDVNILVRAYPLNSLQTYFCVVHEFYIQGEIYTDSGGVTFVNCTIPSYEAIANSATTPIPSNGEVNIRLASGGVLFTASGVVFRFLDQDQVNGVTPLNGPDTGGTNMTVTLSIDQTQGDIGNVYCLFYGSVSVLAVAAPPFDYFCITPALNYDLCNSGYDCSSSFGVSDTTNKKIVLYKEYAVVEVEIRIADTTDSVFQFTYNRGLEIVTFDPPFGFYDQAKTLTLRGNNYFPHIQIECKYTIGTEIILPANYMTNKTVGCDIPALDTSYTLPYFLNVELSFNSQRDWTSNGINYAYCKKSIVNSMIPTKGPVTGNTVIQINYGTLGQSDGCLDILDRSINPTLTSAYIHCRFELSTDATKYFETTIQSHDTTNKLISCNTPSANLILGTLFSSGGDVKVSLTGTDETFVFSYEPVSEISGLSPNFIFAEDNVTIEITGTNFFFEDIALTKIILKSQDIEVQRSPSMINSTHMTVEYYENEFAPRSRVEVTVTFNGEEYYKAPEFISVSERFTLEKLSQEIISTAATTILIDIYEEADSEGGIWDTQENLKCSYNGGAYIEKATYISSFLVQCDLPSASFTTLDVSLIIDATNLFISTNSLTIKFVNAPTFGSISDTGIFLTLSGARSLLYSPLSQRTATITGSGFQNSPNNTVYAYFEGGEVFEITANSDTEIQLPLPITDPGYVLEKVYISVDKNYFSAVSLVDPIHITSCPDGSYCEGILTTTCPAGTFCPKNQLGRHLACGPGYLQTSAGSLNCDQCSDGTDSKFCPYSSGSQVSCPQGFICNNKTDRIEADMNICPEGLVCDSTTTTIDISAGIGTAGAPAACPNGRWCGKGTYSGTHISGDMRTSQFCFDGNICGQNADWTSSTTFTGSKDSYGSYKCPISQFCQDGKSNPCPDGAFCPIEGISLPDYCQAGFFSTLGATECSKCKIGTFCPKIGTFKPIQCSPGSVCQLDAQLGITQLCPAGSYCVSKTVTQRISGHSIDVEYIPVECDPGTYCLSGVYTPIVNSSNPQAAQNCIEGSYCEKGTSSPSGTSCPPGHYCPKNSHAPTPTDPGYFASGYGNVQQEPCPPGTFSNQSIVSECTVCPAGYECPSEATIVPTLCGQGTYKPENFNLIFCELCPQGTWSNKTGLTAESECTLCEPKIVCIVAGMTSLNQSIDCPEGYVCPNYGTTSFTMFSNPCPEGYYCGTRTSTISDYHYCDRGLYCPKASTSTGRTQNKCLSGYFCPLGTAAELNSLGTFENVYQLPVARALEGTPSYPPCSEDNSLPSELIEQYIAGGTQLKCPEGTGSGRGAWCIGQCVISSETIVDTFNPVNGSSTVDGDRNVAGENTDYNGRMLGEKDENSGRNLATDPLSISLYEYTLDPLHTAKIYMDFSDVPSGFIYNTHYRITITDEDNTELTLPRYFSSSISAFENRQLEIRVHNMNSEKKTFKFGIYLLHGLFKPYKEFLRNKVSIFMYYSTRSNVKAKTTFGFLISSTFLNDITIPYNAPDVTADQTFFLDMTASIGLLPTRGYDKDVYDSTYWQSRQITSAIMSWVPFFSNCEGYDSKVLFYDIVERNSECQLPFSNQTKVVDPIPMTGMNPTADECKLQIKCRYDEVIDTNVATSNRWYSLKESQTIFLMTRDPINSDTFFSKSGDSDDTGFVSKIADGSDALIEAEIFPMVQQGMPTNVTLKILYYQRTSEAKRIVKVSIILSDYEEILEQEDAQYTLNIEYRAMNFFELINNFQFSIYIYILLFTIISMFLFLSVLFVWFIHYLIMSRKKPPVIKFMHMARVTFGPPTIGSLLASIPIFCAAGLLKFTQNLEVLDGIPAEWSNQGSEIDDSEKTLDKRGRLGVQFIIIGFVCLFYGASVMISKPSTEEEKIIIENNKKQRIDERLDDSLSGSQSTMYDEKKLAEEDDREEDVKVRSALTWKRRHFLVMCMIITIGLLVKLQFSYTKMFSDNIYTFLILFMIMDIILEQLLNRVIMSESLLVSPILGAFVITEFIMTMGADDFQNFIISYFIETALVVGGRIYIGPAVERIEYYTQKLAIWLSLKFSFAERIFRRVLRRQLLIQTQLQNLSEFHHFNRNRQKETGEGMEALLGSVASYASQVQALFITPIVLIFIIFFAQETKIPQSYSIRKTDLNYYLIFTVILIIPQLVINIFLLHILEILHGFKIYDYLTYCDYKFKNRSKKWINQQALDKSILHSFRSLDNMSFSSQFYFIITLVTWGIVILDLGLITMIENKYNPFGDPVLITYIIAIVLGTFILKLVLNTIAGYFSLWKQNPANDHLKLDVRAITILDKEHDMRRLLNLIYHNQGFRHKFIRVNRAWVIENLAKVLNREYVMNDDDQFLLNVYQEAVNADHVEEKLKKEQEKIQKDLALMPYNKKDEELVDVSDDTIGDIPNHNWVVPDSIDTVPKIKKLSHTWLKFARQFMKLKEMIVDIVVDKLDSKCARCKSTFRLQVIQEYSFYKVAEEYRKKMKNVGLTRKGFRRFYNHYQKFSTLCMECAWLRLNDRQLLAHASPI